jgi:hypothetical protein
MSLLLMGLVLLTINDNGQPWRVWNNGLGIAKMFVFTSDGDKANEIKRRWDDIGDSLKNSSSPFAGTYIQSGNSGYFLRWSPEKGFVFVYYHEYFIVDASYGRVEFNPPLVKFIVDHEMTNKFGTRKPVTPSLWVPVYDGKFLVGRDQVDDFAGYVGGFSEYNGFPRNWNCDCAPFAERADDNFELRQAPSFILPKEFRQLVKPPISGEIIGVGRRTVSRRPISENSGELASVTPVTLNRGRRDGVKRNMFLFLEHDIEGTHQIVKILKVNTRTSIGIVIREIDDKRQENYPDWNDESSKPRRLLYPELKIGIKVSTRFQETI